METKVLHPRSIVRVKPDGKTERNQIGSEAPVAQRIKCRVSVLYRLQGLCEQRVGPMRSEGV